MFNGLPSFSRAAAAACLTAIGAASHAAEAEITVRVSNIASASGEVGCALFPAGSAFPMDASSVRQQWHKADTSGVTCRFDRVTPGQWAVSASHDLNGNRKVDANFLGIPTEAWGVSNNIRPALRAPRFDEASFKVSGGQPLTIEIKVDR